MTDQTGRDGIPDAVDETSRQEAADDQRAERDRLDDEAREKLAGDPGDPRDRLPDNEHDRLMQGAAYREIHS
jgi:hypothetical protein